MRRSIHCWSAVIAMNFVVACGNKDASPAASSAAPEATPPAEEPKQEETQEEDPGEKVIVKPENEDEGAFFFPEHVYPDPDMKNQPASLPLPKLRTDLDPRNFKIQAAYEVGRAAPDLVPPAGKFLIPQDGHAITYPPCDFPVPAFKPAKDLKWKVDGQLDDWKGQGLVAFDRKGDGTGGLKDRDVTGLYFGEDSKNFYIFVETAGDFRKSNADTAPLHIEMMNILPGADAHKASQKHARWMQLTKDWWWEWAQGNTAKKSDFKKVPTAFSDKGVEIALPKNDPFFSTLTGTFVVSAKFHGDKVFPPFDVVVSPVVGMIADYSCIVPTPLSGYKVLTMQRGKNIKADVAEITYRAATVALPAVENVIGMPFAAYDTYGVLQPDQHPGGGGVQLAAGISIGQNVVKDTINILNYRMIEITAHEFAHVYNTAWWAMNLGWMGEGHSDMVKLLVDQEFYGPMVSHLKRLGVLYHVKATEAAEGVKELSSFNYTGNVPYYYSKSGLFWREMVSGPIPLAALHSVFEKPAREGKPRPVDSDAWLDLIAAHKDFKGTPSWNGWVFGTSYAGARFPMPADSNGTTSTKQDGMSDVFKKAMGLKVTDEIPKADRRLTADNLLSDWEALYPASLKTPDPARTAKKTTATCKAGTHFVKYGARTDGDWVMIAIQMDGAPPAGYTNFGLSLFFERPDGKKLTMTHFPGGRNHFIYGYVGGKLVKTAMMVEPAGQTIELFYHRGWASFPGGFTKGTKFGMYVNADTGTGNETCDGIANILVEQ